MSLLRIGVEIQLDNIARMNVIELPCGLEASNGQFCGMVGR
jgi:hypothetical protein